MANDPELTIESLYRDAHQQLEACERDAAAASAEKALHLAETTWGMDDVRLIHLLALLAACVAEVQFGVHDEKPLPHLQRAIAIAESNLAPEHPWCADLYRQMGLALQTAGQLETAADTLRRSIAIFGHLGRTDDETFCLGALATTLMKFDEEAAVPVCRRYVELAATRPNSTTHLAAVSQLGRCLLLVQQGEEALSVLAEARAMLLQRTKGHPHRWITEIDEQIEEARALVARSRPAPR